ncbi:MAG TPA: DUF934 domain-containing protein [Steroidobacteraceae bacterium]|nr:DUF934 domain-containing protein [Steroidobacteraceae bacterium]
MRKLLRPPELIEDPWRYAGEEPGAGAPAVAPTAGAHAGGIIVALATFLADPVAWADQPVGVRVAPGDRVEDLAPHLPRLGLVAIEFPGPGEGRGYTCARLLRQRYGFAGEVRAVGPAVRQDLLFFMARCGFDSFELAPGEDAAQALQALSRYTLAYQRGVPYPPVREARFSAP